uniref:Ubiquitin-like domain-containing protein n=1 Tax=Echeneis naucrates TaxID=173247 RepID=A0A665X391_ECHNA
MEQQRGLWSFSPARSARIAGQDTMRLAITSTTGSPVELTVPRGETVEGLRTRISQRLRLQTDRILLLHKDRQLSVGKLLDLGVADGSKLTLVPVIEAGLCSTVKAERTVMDVLESLTEIQISDFLSGRSPLTINLGIGAQTMYVQLQLSEQDAKKLQQDGEGTVQSSSEHQTGLPVAAGVNHAGSALALSSTSTTGSTTSLPFYSFLCLTMEGENISLFFFQNRIHASPSAELYRQPGAVIDSFVSHSPGVFSGTFSGTLAPQSQSISHPRRGIAIILQILNDLLRAASSHQRAPAPLRQHCPVPSHPVSPVPAEEPSKARGKPLVVQRTEHLSTGSGQLDQTLQCKLERLQFLMHQQRLRRQTRRSSHFSKTSHPYQHRHHCP